MHRHRVKHIIAIVASLLFLGGCAVSRRHPVVPLPVRLVSPEPFVAHVRARGDTAATSCPVLRVTGTVEAVRGDTVEFAALRSDLRPRRAVDCLQGRAGYIVLSAAPDLRAETTIARHGRTVGLVLVSASVWAIVGLMALLAAMS